MTIVQALLGMLLVCGLVLLAAWVSSARRNRQPGGLPGPFHALIGFVVNFFDTLGIGSFATTTAAFRLWRLVPDELIPGTLLVGLALPVIAQALIFITVVEVNPSQMAILIASCAT